MQTSRLINYYRKLPYEVELRRRKQEEERKVSAMISSASAQTIIKNSDEFVDEYFTTYGRLYS